MLKRIVDGLQVVAIALVVLTIGLLFRPGPVPADGVAFESVGAQVYSASCARCHGADGSGGLGPSLISGNMFERFPDRLATMDFIESGQGSMPSFSETLTEGEIGAVADFVRKELATQGR